MGFEHYLYLLKEDSSAETLTKVIKHTVDMMLSL